MRPAWANLYFRLQGKYKFEEQDRSACVENNDEYRERLVDIYGKSARCAYKKKQRIRQISLADGSPFNCKREKEIIISTIIIEKQGFI